MSSVSKGKTKKGTHTKKPPQKKGANASGGGGWLQNPSGRVTTRCRGGGVCKRDMWGQGKNRRREEKRPALERKHSETAAVPQPEKKKSSIAWSGETRTPKKAGCYIRVDAPTKNLE